ncbi:MAG: phosphoribosyl-AMP cyclohydrolase [Nitrospinae bacterium]|nr:phosphoribosyl-AMP cyclohydrolase [Nitrospinota bacterium]
MGKEELEEGSSLSLDFEKRGGLLPVIAQDASDGSVLMLGYVNREALDETVRSGVAVFWSTSRGALWKKGETSGDYLKMVDIYVDCDQDALIYVVAPQGAGACHTKDPKSGAARKSCFYRKIDFRTGKLADRE